MRRYVQHANGDLVTSLNPYSNGICSMSYYANYRLQEKLCVLILILMEYAL